MMNPRILILPLLTFLLSSCNKSHLIRDSEKKWLPYKENDEIIFLNKQTGDTDTLTITEIESSMSFYGHRKIGGNKVEDLSVYCISRYLDTVNGLVKRRHNRLFLKQRADLIGDSHIEIIFLTKNGSFLSDSSYTPKYFDTAKVYNLNTNFSKYNDILIFENEKPTEKKKENGSNFIIMIDRLYWSKSNGIIKYDIGNQSFEMFKKYSR